MYVCAYLVLVRNEWPQQQREKEREEWMEERERESTDEVNKGKQERKWNKSGHFKW